MNYLSEARMVFRHTIRLQSTRLSVANYSKSNIPTEEEVYDEDLASQPKLEEILVDETVDLLKHEKEVVKMRNKSRLNKAHRNFLFNQPEPMHIDPDWYVGGYHVKRHGEDVKWASSVFHARRQFARFGSKTKYDPRLCFYTPEEIADKQEFERVSHPLTIQEMVEIKKKEKAEKLEMIKNREDKIAQNLTKLDKWIADLNARVAKKEAEANKAKAIREQLLEDLRQEFGFKITPKDPRYQELMEKKETEAKKLKKAEKKKQREEQLVAKLREQALQSLSNSDEKNAEKDAEGKKTKEKTKKKAASESNDSDSDDDDKKKK